MAVFLQQRCVVEFGKFGHPHPLRDLESGRILVVGTAKNVTLLLSLQFTHTGWTVCLQPLEPPRRIPLRKFQIISNAYDIVIATRL